MGILCYYQTVYLRLTTFMSISRNSSQTAPKPCHAVYEAFGAQSSADLAELQTLPDADEVAAQAAQHIIQETAQELANPDLGLEFGGRRFGPSLLYVSDVNCLTSV